MKPVASPFSVEPSTIVTIKGRAFGENQAEAPSRNPKIAPTVNPRTGLLIGITPSRSRLRAAGEGCTATAGSVDAFDTSAASSSSTARERAIQFFEPLIDFRPACLLAGDLRCRLRLLRLEPLDFGRRTRQVLLDDGQLALESLTAGL